MITKTHTKLILNMYTLFSKFYCLFFLKIKHFQKIIFITLFLQIYNFFLLILLFLFEMIYILLTIVIMHDIFPISFSITKILSYVGIA